ncbi:thiamine-phosphate kinase [Pseudoclavibacter caeni]|jgi:thiamine-monophosphate kinase|uniref:Thiamine-monophosphate kinase n=1 Tax=Pseudoclavibacter caeni TaxID=908846 RepID=A0A7C8FJ14_9MICO|nr:thiamine-phosphate kinase [Pseudoclavibacter caeni]KAB1632886.1 thiamine-phosphate kinase [Pseudoclavibacter caeni]NYJ97152.1 thiamine-monophosphate kinase [Pseudoclavibacter caeni]
MKVSLGTRLDELAEEQLVAILRQAYPTGAHPTEVADDDAAVATIARGSRLVTSTDLLVEHEDFVLPEFTPYDVGWKTAAVNLSDIAAMGARPTGLLMTLGIPRDRTVADLVGWGRGVRDAVATLAPGVSVWGGDLSASRLVISAATSTGEVEIPVTRAGAEPGDVVAYAGRLGFAAAGLRILLGERAGDPDLRGLERTGTIREAIDAQLRPRPPIALGAAAAVAGVHALIDVSDGLARDGARLARSSGVTLDLVSGALAGRCADLGWARHTLNIDPWELVMAGGEDYGLLAVFAPDARPPEGFEVLGAVVERGEHGVLLSGRPTEYLGFDHFAGR